MAKARRSDLRREGADRFFAQEGAARAKCFHGVEVDPDGRELIGFWLRGDLNRLEYGLTWNRALKRGGLFVGDTVELVLDGVASRDVALEHAA